MAAIAAVPGFLEPREEAGHLTPRGLRAGTLAPRRRGGADREEDGGQSRRTRRVSCGAGCAAAVSPEESGRPTRIRAPGAPRSLPASDPPEGVQIARPWLCCCPGTRPPRQAFAASALRPAPSRRRLLDAPWPASGSLPSRRSRSVVVLDSAAHGAVHGGRHFTSAPPEHGLVIRDRCVALLNASKEIRHSRRPSSLAVPVRPGVPRDGRALRLRSSAHPDTSPVRTAAGASVTAAGGSRPAALQQ